MPEGVRTHYIDGPFSEFAVKLAKELAKQRSITRGPQKEGDKIDSADSVNSSRTAE